MAELLLGCGRRRDKRVFVPGARRAPDAWQGLVTLDINPAVEPDLQCDLNGSTPWYVWQLNFATEYLSDKYKIAGNSINQITYELQSDYWDEIHAYEVLEHLGQQGDAHSFLAHFSEIWRLLKPDGYLCATVPSRYSPWLWGDPSHRRAILPESLVFLDQEQYAIQCDGASTSMSDFRQSYGYWADFRLIDQHDDRKNTFTFILQAVKPSRRKV